MVWEIVFAHGPEENRAKPMIKYWFCMRSLGKQMKRSDICSFSLKIVGKQR